MNNKSQLKNFSLYHSYQIHNQSVLCVTFSKNYFILLALESCYNSNINLSKVYSSALHPAAMLFTPARRFRNFSSWKEHLEGTEK